jgi:hypothetical protein
MMDRERGADRIGRRLQVAPVGRGQIELLQMQAIGIGSAGKGGLLEHPRRAIERAQVNSRQALQQQLRQVAAAAAELDHEARGYEVPDQTRR